jgi:hypothetical protein
MTRQHQRQRAASSARALQITTLADAYRQLAV